MFLCLINSLYSRSQSCSLLCQHVRPPLQEQVHSDTADYSIRSDFTTTSNSNARVMRRNG